MKEDLSVVLFDRYFPDLQTNSAIVNNVKKLDADMRNKEYTPELWKSETGKIVDELWSLYAANPSLT